MDPLESNGLASVRHMILAGMPIEAEEALSRIAASGHGARIESGFIALLRDQEPGSVLSQLPDEHDLLQEDIVVNCRYWLLKGILENRRGDQNAAHDFLKKGEALAASHGYDDLRAETLLEIARVHAWAGQEVRSLRNFSAALASLLFAENSLLRFHAYLGLAKLNLEMGRAEDAVNYFNHAERVRPGEGSIFRQRFPVEYAPALLAADRYEDCLRLLEQMPEADVLALSSHRWFTKISTLAFAHMRAGNRIDAETLLAKLKEQYTADIANEYRDKELSRLKSEFELRFGSASHAVADLQDLVKWYAAKSYTQPVLALMRQIIEGQVAQGDVAGAEVTLLHALEYARKTGTVQAISTLRELRDSLDLSEIAVEETGRAIGYKLDARQGAYVLREQLGGGAYGTVYRAIDLDRDGMEVALKKFDLSSIYNPRVRTRLLASLKREIQACAQLPKHTGWAKVISWGEDSDHEFYLAQEYKRGPTLASLMQSNSPSPQEAVLIIKNLCLTLEALHGCGVLHCDLKPENIIMDTPTSPVLVDFGVANLVLPRSRAIRGGTKIYMSPESMLGLRARSSDDLYAVAVILLELLGHSPPEVDLISIKKLAGRQRILNQFRMLTSSRLNQDGNKLLSTILRDCLKPRVYGRLASAKVAARGFEEVLQYSAEANATLNTHEEAKMA